MYANASSNWRLRYSASRVTFDTASRSSRSSVSMLRPFCVETAGFKSLQTQTKPCIQSDKSSQCSKQTCHHISCSSVSMFSPFCDDTTTSLTCPIKSLTYHTDTHSYMSDFIQQMLIHNKKILITSLVEVMFLLDFVCLSVCEQDNSKSYGRIFLKFWGYVGHGINYQWLNFGGDPAGILDSGSLWNFCYHCFQWGIREPLAKRRWWRHLANSFALAEVPAGYDCYLVSTAVT